jgi:tetratricopeptide (TPR) repeat protein
MSIKGLSSLIIAVIFCASVAQAKTATEVFEKVSPSIVVVRAYDAKGKDMMLGSGVVWEDGVVVTNCHVVKEAVTVQVERQDRKYPATLLQSDWDRDICSLAVDELKGQVITKGSTNRLKVGDKVYAVGAPQGLELTLSDGLISSLRPVENGQYLQITAPISPGSSGGGLFDDEGRLIGLPTFYLTEGQQLNFAVPVEWVLELPKRNAPALKTGQTTSNEWLSKAIEFEEKKDWPGLIKHALRWTRARPKDADAWYNLGNAYGQSNQPAKAIEACQQAIRINPEYASAWYNLGVAYGESNQPATEIAAYQQALRINPEHASAWYNLGNAYVNSNQLPKAVDAYQQAIRINPEHASAWFNLGVAYGQSNQPAKAIEAHQQALRINPEHANAWIDLGNAYGESNQTAKEIDAYQQAIRINPEHASAWYNLGVAYKLNGQTSQVMEVYKRLKTLDPAQADLFFNKVVMP